MIRKLLIGLAFCLICPQAFAALFSVAPSDRSQQYLGVIFGGSVGSIYLGGGSSNPMLSLMFERFNFIIVTVGVVVLSYLGVTSTINTAREGEAGGKKLSMWVPLRAFFGMLMMVPTPGSGYSVVQMTVLWIVLNGIGAANAIWNTVLTQVTRGIAPVGNISYPQAVTANNPLLKALAGKILASRACMASLNNMASSLSTNPQSPFLQGQVSPFLVVSPPSLTPTSKQQVATIYVGIQGAGNQYWDMCGSFRITETLSEGNRDIIPFNDNNLIQRLNIMTSVVQTMFGVVSDAGDLIASSQTPTPGYVVNAANAFAGNILQLATLNNAPSSNIANNIINNIMPLGWIHAGSYYYQLMTANSTASTTDNDITPLGLNNFAGNVPSYAGNLNANNYPSSVQTAGWNQSLTSLLSMSQATTLNTSLQLAASYANSDSYAPPPLPAFMGGSSTSTGSGMADEFFNGAFGTVKDAAAGVMQQMTTSESDPLSAMAHNGTKLMQAAEGAAFVFFVIAAALQLGLSINTCMLPFGNMITSVIFQATLLIGGLLVLLWTAGATLGVYVPLIPFFVFTSTAFGWMIAVVEAVVGAPLIALGMVHPSGEELGKVGPALSIVANLFLRPTLMIFGFVLGANLLKSVLQLINFGFGYATTSGQTGGGSIMTYSSFSFIPLLITYGMFVITATNKSFSLIYLLPDKIMRWMGAPQEQSDAADMMREVKSGFDSGAAKGQEGLTAAHNAAVSKAGKSSGGGGKGGGDKGGGGKGGGNGKGGGQQPSGDGGQLPSGADGGGLADAGGGMADAAGGLGDAAGAVA